MEETAHILLNDYREQIAREGAYGAMLKANYLLRSLRYVVERNKEINTDFANEMIQVVLTLLPNPNTDPVCAY